MRGIREEEEEERMGGKEGENGEYSKERDGRVMEWTTEERGEDRQVYILKMTCTEHFSSRTQQHAVENIFIR